MLTREELAKMRLWYRTQYPDGMPTSVCKLLTFAETMLSLRDALLALMAAEAEVAVAVKESLRGKDILARTPRPRGRGRLVDECTTAAQGFWKLAREMADTDAEVEK